MSSTIRCASASIGMDNFIRFAVRNSILRAKRDAHTHYSGATATAIVAHEEWDLEDTLNCAQNEFNNVLRYMSEQKEVYSDFIVKATFTVEPENQYLFYLTFEWDDMSYEGDDDNEARLSAEEYFQDLELVYRAAL